MKERAGRNEASKKSCKRKGEQRWELKRRGKVTAVYERNSLGLVMNVYKILFLERL